MASETPLPIRITQAVGITSAILAAGSNLAYSFFVVPRILEAPAPLLIKQWQNMFDQGKKTVAPWGIATGGVWFWLAWNAHKTSGQLGKVRGYVTAGVLCVAMVPYTFVFLMPTNRKLAAKLERLKVTHFMMEGEGEGESAHQLVDRWALLNLPRGFALLAGGVLGLWTVMA